MYDFLHKYKLENKDGLLIQWNSLTITVFLDFGDKPISMVKL